MRGLILSVFTAFIGFVIGIAYTVQAADSSFVVRLISVIKALI